VRHRQAYRILQDRETSIGVVGTAINVGIMEWITAQLGMHDGFDYVVVQLNHMHESFVIY